MGIRRRRDPGLPGDAAEALGIGRGDPPLAWSPLAGGGVAVATRAGLRVLTPFGKVIRRPWSEVDHVAWDGGSTTFAVWWVGSRQPTPLELRDAGRMPEVVRERVQASVVLSRDVPLPGGRTVWVALRRDVAPGHGGRGLFVQVVPPPGVRLDDPEVAGPVGRAQEALRAEASLGTADRDADLG